MKCSNCGKKINKNDKFCQKCGSKNETNHSMTENENASNDTTQGLKKVKGNSKTVKTIVGFLIVLVLAIGIGFIVKNPMLEMVYGKLAEYNIEKDFDESIEWAKKVFKINPDNTLLAEIYVQGAEKLITSDPKVAVKYLKKASSYGDEDDYKSLLAEAYENYAEDEINKDPIKALELISQSMSYDSSKTVENTLSDISSEIIENLVDNDLYDTLFSISAIFESSDSEIVKDSIIDLYLEIANKIKYDDYSTALEIVTILEEYDNSEKVSKFLNEMNMMKNYDIKIGLVTDSGSITDQSYNQNSWEGILKAERDFGIESKYLQPYGMTTYDYLDEIEELVYEGFEIIVTPGFMFGEAVYIAQDEYPNVQFVMIDAEPISGDYSDFRIEENTLSIYFTEHEAGFQAGIAAALESKTGKVGFIGGMEIPPVQKYGWGFVAGVAYANDTYGTNAEVTDYIYQGSFSEVEAGQQLAASMYDKGIDVIFAAAGGVGYGVINEAKTRTASGDEVFIIGVDVDQYNSGLIEDGRSVILTSAIKRIDTVTYYIIENYLNGNFNGGQKQFYSIKDDAVGLPNENPNLANHTVSMVNDASLAVKNGSVTVPETLYDLNYFLSNYSYSTPYGVSY